MPPKSVQGGGGKTPPKSGTQPAANHPAGPAQGGATTSSPPTSNERLFLLEVLIDKIIFLKSPCFSDKGFRTCVKISFLSVDPIEICDDDSASDVPSGGPFIKNFNNGKSCLFSLKEADIDTATQKFRIHVSVSKSLPCGCLPTHVVMGEANIDMTKEFIQAKNKNTNQALKDSFRIMAPDGHSVAGNILMFLRISCFGKNIVTKFQGGQAPPLLGGGGTSGVDHSCKAGKDFQTSKDPCRCGAVHSGGGAHTCDASSGGGGGTCPRTKDPYNSRPCEDPDDPCYCSGPKPLRKDEMKCRNTDKYCLHVPKGRSYDYEEIGTNLNGNELKIKVPKNSSVIKKISQTNCTMQRPYTKGGKGEGECDPPCGKNQISLELPSEAICCRGAQLQATQFTCTTEGCTTASKHGQTGNLARGDKISVLPNLDVFVLKVAKTALQGDRKCKVEFELVTPKAGDKIPPIEKVDTNAQCECTCCRCLRGK